MQVDVLEGPDVEERIFAVAGVGHVGIIHPDESQGVALAVDRQVVVGAGNHGSSRGAAVRARRGRECRNPFILEGKLFGSRQGEDLSRIADKTEASEGIGRAGRLGVGQGGGVGPGAVLVAQELVDRWKYSVRRRDGTNLAACRVDRGGVGLELEIPDCRVHELGIAEDSTVIAPEIAVCGRDIEVLRVVVEQVVLQRALARLAQDVDRDVRRSVEDVVHRQCDNMGDRVLTIELRGDCLDRVPIIVECVVEQHELLGALAAGIIRALGTGEDTHAGYWRSCRCTCTASHPRL